MRHNHKNHIGSPCRFVHVFDVRSPKSEKPRCFCQKTENQMLKKGKTGNHNGQQNRTTDVFHCKNRKTDLENVQNRKTEDPNAPLMTAACQTVWATFWAVYLQLLKLLFHYVKIISSFKLFFKFISPGHIISRRV